MTHTYNVNGTIEQLTTAEADELHDAGVNITPVEEDEPSHDDGFDCRRIMDIATTGWVMGGRRWG